MPRATTALTLFFCLALTTACGSASVTVSPAREEPVSPVVDLKKSVVEGLPADEIWKLTRARLDQATSFHVAGHLPPQSTQAEYTQFNFTVSDSGRAFGTLQTGTSGVLVRRYGTVLYFRGNRGFWHEDGTEPKSQARAGHWNKVTQDGRNDYQELFDLTDKKTVLARALRLVDDEVGRMGVVDGNEAYSDTPNIGLTSDAEEDTDTVFVSTTGLRAPELLQISLDDEHYLRFDTWDDPVRMGAPETDAVSLDR